MARYLVYDLEVQNNKTYKRFANPFDPINYIVARGWKIQGDARNSWDYWLKKCPENRLHIPDDVTLIVGHNLKFDLLYEWNNPEMKAFFKRGGRVWDTQYAEYLIQGARQEYHMVAMDTIAEYYGGRKKIDEVKALWEMGVLTADIDKDMLIDYLVGTEDEDRNSGDIGNTEKIFLGQVEAAKKKSMLTMIATRMDGLCATTEMEWNGLKIDVEEGRARVKDMGEELLEMDAELEQYVPELPPELVFNWASPVHKSALIFGGTLKYTKKAPYLLPDGVTPARKQAVEQWPLFDGYPSSPHDLAPCPNHYPTIFYPGQDVYTSGKKKGQGRFKAVKVEGEVKEKNQEFHIELPGYTVPDKKWETKNTDAAGHPVYQSSDDVIEELASRDIPFLKLMSKRQSLVKDLGTYYVRWDEKKQQYVGMLTCVMKGSHIIHHSLNHTSTVTTRLSSSDPNCQNIPQEGTSSVKKMFVSRFKGGKMIEIDYSQLEIVVQGLLTLDKQLIEDLLNKVDFHCKRVAVWKGITYEEAVHRCKDATYPEHKLWKGYRTDAKVFSFQRAYGAGAAKISLTTGMNIDDVKDLIEAEELLYPDIITFNQRVEQQVVKSAVPFKDPIRGFRPFRRGYWQAPTGTMYSFRTWDSLAFQRKKGIMDSFMPTEMKNYPIQGTGGEIVQMQLGLLWRHFVANDNYGGRALLCNTVHDCVWIDSQPDVVHEVAGDAKRILEDVPASLERIFGIHSPVPFPCEVEVGDNLFNKSVYHV